MAPTEPFFCNAQIGKRGWGCSWQTEGEVMEVTEACCKALCSFAVSAAICFVFLFCCRLLNFPLFFLALQEFPALLSCFGSSSPPFLGLRAQFYCNFPTFGVLVTLCNLILALDFAVISSPLLSNCFSPQLRQRELRRAPGTAHVQSVCKHNLPRAPQHISALTQRIE